MDKNKAAKINDMKNALQAALAESRPGYIVEAKSMFGGAGFYADGRMMAAWFGDGLALKLPQDAQKELLRINGAATTQSKQYTEVPETFLDNPSLLAPWAVQSVDYVSSIPAKSRKRPVR
jgi:TfoX/Sxy family transcriptional regulator of competence genes